MFVAPISKGKISCSSLYVVFELLYSVFCTIMVITVVVPVMSKDNGGFGRKVLGFIQPFLAGNGNDEMLRHSC